MGFVVNFIEANHFYLQLIGSIVLGFFGLYTFMYNPVAKLKNQRENKISYTQDLVTGFLLTFSNVLIVLLYIGLFAHFNFVLSEYSIWMLIGGILCIGIGAIVWWFSITYAISKIKKWFNIRDIWMLNRIVGTIIMVLSIGGFIYQMLELFQ
jgi:threonine/homoserine/homoserine lactone efflux protein